MEPILKTSVDCVIVANGEFPKHPLPLSVLKSGVPVIACDGAVNKLLNHGIEPDYIVGDLDSISTRINDRFMGRVYHNPDQETNDLTKSVRFASSRGFRRVAILGATGIREDHTLANISLLAMYISELDSVEMITDYGVFKAITRSTRFESFKKQKISIFSLPPLVSVSVSNLKYPILNRELPVWWEGSLNESIGDYFDIDISGEGLLIIYAVHKDIL